MRTLRNRTGRLGWAAALMSAAGLCIAVPDAGWAQGVPQAPAVKAKPKKAAKAAAPGPQAGEADAAAASKDPAAALAAYTAGVKSYQAGKYDAAAQSLTSAINTGGLTAAQMPRALYYRGAAYQHLGQSGQAISDLTSSLWIKPGLDDGERAEATKLRSAAYRDAGLDESGQPVRAAVAPSETGSVGSSARMSATGSEPVAAPSSGLGGIGNVFGSLFGGSSPTPAPAAPVAAPAPVVAPFAEPRAQAVAAAPAAAAGRGEVEVLPWATRGAEPAPSSEPQASPPAAATAKAMARAKAKDKAKERAAAKAAAAKPAAAPKAAAVAAAGAGVRIQVASVKSRDEASAIISKLKGMGPGVASVGTSVDETTFGSNTYFTVRLGPYASAGATEQPCKALKAGGLDCLVTAE